MILLSRALMLTAICISISTGPSHAEPLGSALTAFGKAARSILDGRLSPSGEDIIGTPKIHDGDTLYLKGQAIRLYGIDAPELGQSCLMPGELLWSCGQDAFNALAQHVARKHVRCRPYDQDSYGRKISICYINGEDLGRWMVLNGYAVSYEQYSSKYQSDEQEARRLRRGIWSSHFDVPWVWRRDYD